MDTIDGLIRDYKGRFSREGWPLGKYPHRIGTIHTQEADHFVRSLVSFAESNLAGTVSLDDIKVLRYSTEPSICNVIAVVRCSVDKLSTLKAFLSGYKAAFR